MHFTKFELINIQKHKNLTLKLTTGLNIIHGDTGVGKTGVLRGLMWLYGERQRSIVRDGEKKCSFTATLDSGIKIKRIKQVTRDKETDKIKSTTINRYEVYYPDKEEPVTYNKVGKKIPPEIAELLGKVELEVDGEQLLLDFTKQKEPYFFLAEKGSFRMKILNKLTGCEVLDRTVHSYNKDITRINREKGILETELNSNREHASKINDELTTKRIKLQEVKILIDEIKKLGERNRILKSALNKDEEINCDLQELNLLKSKIKVIDQDEIDYLKNLNNKINTLQPLIINYNKITTNIKNDEEKLSSLQVIDLSAIKKLSIRIDVLSGLCARNRSNVMSINKLEKELVLKKSQQIDISALKDLYNRVKTIKDSVTQLTSKNKAIKTLETQKSTLTKQIEQNDVKIKEMIKTAKDLGLCPNCGFKL